MMQAHAQEGTPVEGVPERAGALLRASSVHALALGTPRGAPGSTGLGSASAPARAPRSRLSSGSGWASEPRASVAATDCAPRTSGSAERPAHTGAALPGGSLFCMGTLCRPCMAYTPPVCALLFARAVTHTRLSRQQVG